MASVGVLGLDLFRGAGASRDITAIVAVLDPSLVGIAGLTVTVTSTPGTSTVAMDHGMGLYSVAITPTVTAREVVIRAEATVSGQQLSATRTALILPTVGDAWDQPEAVPGLVNTTGYEDGPEVSPDGQWLILSSYAFVDALCCLTGCGQPVNAFSAACQTVIGPSSAPERPDMRGAERIMSPTRVRNSCPRLCLTGTNGGEVQEFPLTPIASYGFRRQPDGSFREPFFIGVEADGCNTPFGYSFAGAPEGTSATAIYSHGNLGTQIGLYATPLTLGQPNILAEYTCNGTIEATGVTWSPLSVGTEGLAEGNPNFKSGFVWWDDEYTVSPPRLLAAAYTGSLPNGTAGAAFQLPVGSAQDDLRQPFVDGNTLYFTRNFTISTATFSGDPSLAASWSTAVTELATVPSDTPGDIIVLGEPSVAHLPDGGVELYFVYARRGPTGGAELDVGRVRRRR